MKWNKVPKYSGFDEKIEIAPGRGTMAEQDKLNSVWTFEGRLDDLDLQEPHFDEDEGTRTSVPDAYQPEALSEVSVVTEDDPYLGEVIGAKYRVERKIGQGGMGVVYLGINDSLGQKVAIKFLNRKLADDEGIVGRFLNEARSYCRVNHPNAVTLLEYGQHTDGALYIITEFVEGLNLSETMKSVEGFTTPQILMVGMQLCEVLSVAHAQGVIHRDLKPDNIMLTPQARGRFSVKVLDFGIAKIVDEEDGPTTETGSVFGTPEFMSPEQARGEVADPRSDIYALGIILFFMATGKLPFRGKNKLVVLNKQLHEAPPRPGSLREGVSLKLEAVILKCLNKRPQERFATADDLFEALEELQGQTGKVSGVPDHSREIVRSLRAETVRLGGPEDTDPHAETMAGLDELAGPAILESIELWREPESNRRRKETSPRKVIGALTATLIFLGTLIIWAPWSKTSEEVEISDPIVHGQLLGQIALARDMLGTGNLDGARTALEQAKVPEEDRGYEKLGQEHAALQADLVRMENVRTEYLGLLREQKCDAARELLQKLNDSEKGFRERLERQLSRCDRRAPRDNAIQPRPAVTLPEVKPAQPAVQPAATESVQKPVVPVESPKVIEPVKVESVPPNTIEATDVAVDPEPAKQPQEEGVLPPKMID